jgi:methylthioribose-1-phosphate isomerase
MTDGVKEIPIEARNPDEVRYIQGAGRRPDHPGAGAPRIQSGGELRL